jgi:hypothetical protein
MALRQNLLVNLHVDEKRAVLHLTHEPRCLIEKAQIAFSMFCPVRTGNESFNVVILESPGRGGSLKIKLLRRN